MSLIGAAAAILTCVSCVGRTPATDPARAQRILGQAVATIGGVERMRGVTTWEVEGTGRENLSAEAQGMAPDRPTWREHEERLAVDASTLTVAWQRRTPRNDHSLRWRRFIYGPDSTGFLDLASRRGSFRASGTAESHRRALARRVPHLLLLEAATAARRVTWRGERQIDGEPHDVIDLVTADGATLALILSRAPVALRRVEYRTYLPTSGDVTIGWEWHGWRPDTVLGLIPAGHRVDVDGTTFQEVTYSRFAANPTIEHLFTVAEATPDGNGQPAPVPPATGFPATGTVVPGVHVASIHGFVVMLVEFQEFAVAIEAPARHPDLERIPASPPPRNVSADHIAWIREVAAGKPIRYVVITHHHSDHMGGVRAFAAAGSTLLVPSGDVTVARHALGAPHTIIADGLAGTLGAADIEAVAHRRVIEDTTRRLEVLGVGPNPHTDENLVVWLPDERIMFQGDLFYYGEDTPFPPPGRAAMNRFFATWLEARGIQPAAVYGVHNVGAAGPAALARSLIGR